MREFIMTVSKKEDGQFLEVGKVKVFYPLLSELGIKIDPKEDDKEGFPVYEDDKVQYVFDSVLASVKSNTRNKLISGTATLKPGLAIAETVEALIESGGRSGEALAAIRDMRAKFAEWLKTIGKSVQAQATLAIYAKNREALMLQPQDKKDLFAGYLADFVSTLTPEEVTRFQRPIQALVEATQPIDTEVWD